DCSLPSCLTLTYAVSQAVSGDTINVAAGTYTEAGITSTEKDLTITGAGTSSTIVQGAASAGIASDRVFQFTDSLTPDNFVTIESLTIRYGKGASGGGINTGANLTLNDVAISDNQTTSLNG